MLWRWIKELVVQQEKVVSPVYHSLWDSLPWRSYIVLGKRSASNFCFWKCLGVVQLSRHLMCAAFCPLELWLWRNWPQLLWGQWDLHKPEISKAEAVEASLRNFRQQCKVQCMVLAVGKLLSHIIGVAKLYHHYCLATKCCRDQLLVAFCILLLSLTRTQVQAPWESLQRGGRNRCFLSLSAITSLTEWLQWSIC